MPLVEVVETLPPVEIRPVGRASQYLAQITRRLFVRTILNTSDTTDGY